MFVYILLISFLKIEVSKQVCNIGIVEPDEVKICHFWIKNKSNKKIFIKRLKTTCGCTVCKITKDTIKPKEKTELKVKYLWRDFEGNFSKKIFVELSDSKSDTLITFKIVGYNKSKPGAIMVFLSSNYFYLKELHPDEDKTIFIGIKNTGNRPLIIENISARYGLIKTDLTKNFIEPQEEIWFNIYYSIPGEVIDYIQKNIVEDEIIFKTNDKRGKYQKVKIRFKIVK